MNFSVSRLHRIVFLLTLIFFWFGGAYHLWLRAFYQLEPGMVKVCAKDKRSRTFLDSETYTLFFCRGDELKPVNTSQSEYLKLQKGDAFCYSYNSIFDRKFNFQHRPCLQADSDSPIMKLLDLSEDI